MPKQIIKEIMHFLSKKFDEVTSAIKNIKPNQINFKIPEKLQIDTGETSRKIEDLKISFDTKISELIKVVEKLDNVELSNGILKALENLKETFDTKNLVVNVPDTSEKLEGIISAITKQTTELKPQKSKQIAELLKDIVKAVKGIQLEEKTIDLSGIKDLVKEVKGLRKEAKDTLKIQGMITSVIEAIQSVSLTVPATFKLDDMQLRALKPKGNTSSIYGGPVPARKSIITRVTMANADTEYSHTFNQNAVSWRIKLESQGVSFNYSWTTGKLKVSGDASEYISIPANWLDSRDNTEYGKRTIFFESSSSSMTLEVEEGIS